LAGDIAPGEIVRLMGANRDGTFDEHGDDLGSGSSLLEAWRTSMSLRAAF
jgi:hypothetical protein